MNLYQKVRNIAIDFAMSLNDYPSNITFDEWAKENGKELMMELEDEKFNNPKLHSGLDSLIQKTDELITVIKSSREKQH